MALGIVARGLRHNTLPKRPKYPGIGSKTESAESEPRRPAWGWWRMLHNPASLRSRTCLPNGFRPAPGSSLVGIISTGFPQLQWGRVSPKFAFMQNGELLNL